MKYEQIARFLAGRPSGDSPFSKLEETPTWIEYSRRCNQAWTRLERTQLSKIDTWTKVELKETARDPATVFYPFGGPDFLYAHSFFPTASEYVLVGLEPFGSLPPLETHTEEQLKEYLDQLLGSLQEILALSFFKTDDMKEEFEEEETNGVLPILLFFLARTNHDVIAVERVYIQRDGEISASEDHQSPKKRGAQITARRIWFQAPGSPPKRLYYFSFDLSNHGLRTRPGMAAFLKKRAPVIGFVKAASYLMYRKEFSDVRSLLLADSSVVLQDDSGAPLQCFSESEWTLRFYGRYEKPIQLFETRRQARLAEIYATQGVAKPLPFGFGYRLSPNQSNLMLAERKRSLQ